MKRDLYAKTAAWMAQCGYKYFLAASVIITLQWVEDWGFLGQENSESLVSKLRITLSTGTEQLIIDGSEGLKVQVSLQFACPYAAEAAQPAVRWVVFISGEVAVWGRSENFGNFLPTEINWWKVKAMPTWGLASWTGHLVQFVLFVCFLKNLHFKEKLFGKFRLGSGSNLLRNFLHGLSYSILITSTSPLPSKFLKDEYY